MNADDVLDFLVDTWLSMALDAADDHPRLRDLYLDRVEELRRYYRESVTGHGFLQDVAFLWEGDDGPFTTEEGQRALRRAAWYELGIEGLLRDLVAAERGGRAEPPAELETTHAGGGT